MPLDQPKLGFSGRLESFLLVFFLATLAAATMLIYRGAEADLIERRGALGKELAESLELTDKGVDLLLNTHVIPAAVRTGDRAKADSVIEAFLKEGAELSAVVITTKDARLFTRVSPKGDLAGKRELDEFLARERAAPGSPFVFLPATGSQPAAVVIRRDIDDGGRKVGTLLAKADLDRILGRISAARAYRFPVRVAGLSRDGEHVRAALHSPLGAALILSEVVDRRIGAALLLLLSLALLYFLARVLIAKMVFPFELLVAKLDAVIKGDHAPIDERKYPRLFRPFIGNINRLIFSVIETQERQREALASLALQETAAQVAHDIRSPLAALDTLLGSVAQLPEENRVLLRRAVDRIKDIANNLIEQTRSQAHPAKAVENHLLSSLIEPLITEKRLQFRSRTGVELDAPLDAESYGLFAKVEPTEFKRVLSNLVDNAVDALGPSGKVTVRVVPAEGGRVALTVADDGRGIPPEILARLGQKGETHGKPGGSGLGLHHARTQAEAWGGFLSLKSEPGRGTVATVMLPRASPPAWFVSRLDVPARGLVAVVDDDNSIHQIWKKRLEPLRASGVEVLDFSSPRELRARLGSGSGPAPALFLVDYELIGGDETGLDLIEALRLEGRSVLVTSRCEEKAVLERCAALGVRLIPKGLAGFVPVALAPERRRLDAALVDDDDLVIATWMTSAKRAGKRLEAFSRPDGFFAIAAELDFDTPLYVDGNLADGERGEDVARRAKGLGFRRIFLATGDAPERYRHLDFLEGVTDKTPPWA